MIDAYRKMAAALLPANPPYVLGSPPWPVAGGGDAYAVPCPTSAMRDFLEAEGLWRGWHTVIAFAKTIRDSGEARGLFIHELGHLAHVKPRAAWVGDVPHFAAEAAFESSLTMIEGRFESEPLWIEHEHEFIRDVLHLHFRAVELGWSVKWSELSICGPRYGLSNVLDYVEALNYEPVMLRDKTLAEIREIEPPEAFMSLWLSDTAPRTSR